MTSLSRSPHMRADRRRGGAALRLALLGASLSAVIGCARVNTTLDRVNQGLAALADTAGRPASRSGARPAAGVRGNVPLTLTRPTATRSDSLTASPEGTHRYTLYEVDTRAWPEGGVLTVEVDVGEGWEGGSSIGSFDLYPEGVTPSREGLPQGAVASAWNVAPGQRATLMHRFERGQRLLLGAEGSWSSPPGTKNVYTFRVRVTPSEAPLWTAEGTAADGGTVQTMTVWQDARHVMVLGGDMAVTVALTRGQAWAREMAGWLARAERREATACATGAGEAVSGPALEDVVPTTGSRSGVPALTVTCALRPRRGGPNARPVPTYELAVTTPDGYAHAVEVSAPQLRDLAVALRTK